MRVVRATRRYEIVEYCCITAALVGPTDKASMGLGLRTLSMSYMILAMTEAPYPFEEINRAVENSPTFVKAVGEVGPAVVGKAAEMATGNPIVGQGAKALTATVPSEGLAKVAAHTGFCVATVALTIVATPVFLVALPFLAIKSLFED